MQDYAWFGSLSNGLDDSGHPLIDLIHVPGMSALDAGMSVCAHVRPSVSHVF